MPQPPIEAELKWILTPDQLVAIQTYVARLAGGWTPLQQTNRYLDSQAGDLLRARIGLRLRQENGRVQLTAKWPRAERSDALHQHYEDQQELNAACWALADANLLALPLPSAVRSALGDAELETIGSFRNLRLQKSWDDMVLALDTTDYGTGTNEYELEVETEAPAQAAEHWQQIFADLGIRPRPQPLTKFARLVARLKAG